jgi:alkaline phosphatase D
MKTRLILLFLLMHSSALFAQKIVGPVLGPVTFRTAGIWLSFENKSGTAEIRYWPKGADKKMAKTVRTIDQMPWLRETLPYNIQRYQITDLEPATSYQYEVLVFDARKGLVGKEVPVATGSFTTQTLFQWRTNAPDFTFLTGSCSYFNQPKYDRPGKPYGQDSSIFVSMANEQANFMLWLGDNWYTREVDYSSEWGMWYRAMHDRSQPVLQAFWGKMPHLAIWDDHDYGPNDFGKPFQFKNTSRDVFKQMWMNPTTGENNEGIYTKYTYSDVDFFMLDDRWWRDYDRLPDSVNGQPNQEKRMFGKQQMDWLKDQLRYSKNNPYISFRIIVTGSQVLNPASPYDKLLDFPAEYYELMNFIRDEKIDGVVFLDGDRHHTEIIKVQHEGMYPMYDITCSPLTSSTHTFGGKEAKNSWRVLGIEKLQNYGRISVTGARSNRVMKVEFAGLKGEKLGEWQVGEKELRFGK